VPQNEETTPLNSRLPYAIVKNMGEAFLRSYKQEYGLDYTIFRFFNTFGPRQDPVFVMSKFMDMALRGDDLTVYGDGKQSRTYCYIADNVDATINAITDKSTINEVINIGNDVETTAKELAEKIVKLTGSKSKVVHMPALKEGDMTRRQPDVTKMKTLLGRDFTPLEDGMKKVIAYKKRASK
jgi:UDP-glucose 4-epimerase